MNTRELKSLHSPQKSFYSKAWIVQENDEDGITGREILKSYDVEVCTIEFGHNLTVTIPHMYSKTTKRHIREFIIQSFDKRVWDVINRQYSEGKRRWEHPFTD